MALRFGVNLGCLCRKGYRNLHVGVPNFKIVQFVLSDIGEGIKEVTVRDWFVKVGDKVRQFDDICLVESDKAAVNITSRFDGVITRIYHSEGALALVGQPLVDIDAEGEDPENAETQGDKNRTTSSTPASTGEEAERLDRVTQQEKRTSESALHHDDSIHIIDLPEHKALAAPAVRRIAKEHKVALSDVKGSGKGGRIMKEDILKYLEGKISNDGSPMNKIASTRPTESSTEGDKTIAITGIKRAMAKAMAASHSIPSFGYCDELDVTKLVALRKEIKSQLAKDGVSVTYMPFFIKALSNSLNGFPELNAHVDAKCENMIIKSDHNIGLAVDTPHGLLVPNIKHIQSKSVLEISVELSRLMQKSKDRTLSVQDLSGGTITISNIGIVGGTYVRPLINPPEVAIVGIGRFRKRPVFDLEDKIVAAHTCNASWSADHRVIDGATLARFSELWKHYIENPLKLLLDS